MTAREDRARLEALVVRVEADLGAVAEDRDAGDALAAELGGELALRWRLAVVRAAIEDPPDGDTVRELYGELVDRYRDDRGEHREDQADRRRDPQARSRRRAAEHDGRAQRSPQALPIRTSA